MTIRDLDLYFRSILAIDELARKDVALNGVQVGRSGGPEAEARRVAFAVDACAETIRRAAERGADLLFVHHGIFWERPVALSGAMRERIKLLLDADLALYACHLPLDAVPVFGNNAQLAQALGLSDLEPLGEYRGVRIGWKGRFEPGVSLAEVVKRALPNGDAPLSLLPFGPETLKTAGVVSGGAAAELGEAIASGVDLYVTGESSHEMYHAALEAGVSVISAGHYATETWGVRALSEKLSREKGIETFFLDLPTGL